MYKLLMFVIAVKVILFLAFFIVLVEGVVLRTFSLSKIVNITLILVLFLETISLHLVRLKEIEKGE